MLNSKIAGTTTSFQRFPLKNWNFKIATTKYVFVNNSALSTPIALILIFLPTFVRSRNPIQWYICYSECLRALFWDRSYLLCTPGRLDWLLESTVYSFIFMHRVWMTHNLLKLNDDKTDIIYIASPHFAKSISVPTIKVDDTQIEPSLKVTNLGVIFDQFLKMDDHITTVCKASYFHLKNIRSLKPYLSREALLTVTHSFITTRIDYCNGLLYGITEHNINRLQRVQNCAARLITNTKKYDHITPVLYTLHWLPIRQWVQYKILLLTYKAIKGLAPAYICELISLKTSFRTLRSSDQLTLNTPVARLKSYYMEIVRSV